METGKDGLPVHAFADAAALECWLGQQEDDHPGIWLKLFKKGSQTASVSRQEAVDAGLCFGWIDGLINAGNEHFYLLRFTPRRRKSKWSLINVERAEQLIAEARVRPRGLREIEAARADGRWEAAYPPSSRIEVPDDLQAALDANRDAAREFAGLKGASRYAVLYRLHDVRDPAKRPAAIAKWIEKLSRGEVPHAG